MVAHPLVKQFKQMVPEGVAARMDLRIIQFRMQPRCSASIYHGVEISYPLFMFGQRLDSQKGTCTTRYMLIVLTTFCHSQYLALQIHQTIRFLLPNASRHAMPAYEQKHAMEGSEAYEEEVNTVAEEDVCCEENSMSYQLCNSHFPPDKEKQISVDPVSVKQLAKAGDHLSRSPPPAPPPLGKPKFTSCSLPSSSLSSPQPGSATTKSIKKWKIPSPNEQFTTLSRFTQQQELPLRRSKSCGEGRSCAPSDEFDMLSRRPSMKVPENGVHVLYDCTNDAGNYKDSEELDPGVEENFKCGALCLFLPGFSKKKQVQASQDEQGDQGSVASRAVSLEKFECGSWYSSAVMDVDDENDGAGQSYFDLPLELIRSGADDANSPVKTAFVFDGDRKGVLKKSTSNLAPRRSHEASNRHVRFSTSTPTSYPASPTSACITPRLRKAREAFDAFLEGQGT